VAGEDLALCVTSQLSRSVETADVALGKRALPRMVMQAFNDPVAGDFEHCPVLEFNEWLSHNGPSTQTPGGESQHDAMHRYAAAYDVLLGRQEEVVLAIIHRLPILWLLSSIVDHSIQEVEYATPIHLDAAEVSEALAVLRQDPARVMTY
jgi:broad specificity phosphatase PhoE